jgi:hypothetical protein
MSPEDVSACNYALVSVSLVMAALMGVSHLYADGDLLEFVVILFSFCPDIAVNLLMIMADGVGELTFTLSA